MNREGIADLQNRVHKSIRELGAKHWRNLFARRFKGLAEGIACIAALGTHMTRDAPVDHRTSERVATIEFKKLWHCVAWNAGQEKNG